jgi:hypothetical protein
MSLGGQAGKGEGFSAIFLFLLLITYLYIPF